MKFLLVLLLSASVAFAATRPSSAYFSTAFQGRTNLSDVLSALNSSVGEKEVWLSSTNGSGGDGTLFNPYRCPTDLALSNTFSLFTSTNMTIHFLPGAFLVPNPGIEVRHGWKVSGAGMGNTVMRIVTNAAQNLSMTVFYSAYADNVSISDLLIDCNYQNQFTNRRIANAISVTGKNVHFNRVKAINWGINIVGQENFVIVVGNDSGNADTFGSGIENCVVNQPASVVMQGGVTAISVFTVGPSTSGDERGTVLKGNMANGVVSGDGAIAGHPDYFHGFSDGGTITGNQAFDLTGPGSVAFYRDTWNGTDIAIDGNVFRNCTRGIYFNMPSWHLVGVDIKNNFISLGDGGFGIEYYRAAGTDTNGYIKNLVISGNTVTPGPTCTNANALWIDAGTNHVTVLGNVLQGKGTGADYHSVGTNVTFVGNVNLAGPLP